MAELLLPEQRRRADLLRMKAVATGLLVAAGVGYLLLRRWEGGGAPGWVSYARAATEAGMVGGLADWFAVTALFRRPLGLPIPHTAIVATRKDQIGRALADFVGANFLSGPVVRERLRRSELVRRVGEWLSAHANAERVTAELATVARAAVGVLRDEDVRDVLEQAVVRLLASARVGPPLGRLLGQAVRDRAHDGLTDLALEHAHAWLVANRGRVIDLVARQAPDWSPRLVDELVAARVHSEVVRVVGEVRTDPYHPLREALDRYLSQLAEDLQCEPDTMARADQIARELFDSSGARKAFADLLASARRLLLDLVEDPSSELRVRVAALLADLGRRLQEDDPLRRKLEGWLEDAAAHVVDAYRDELTALITDTVEAWDARATSRKIELQVGRDLQFIRVNGTVVGALAGVAIHAAGQLVL